MRRNSTQHATTVFTHKLWLQCLYFGFWDGAICRVLSPDLTLVMHFAVCISFLPVWFPQKEGWWPGHFQGPETKYKLCVAIVFKIVTNQKIVFQNLKMDLTFLNPLLNQHMRACCLKHSELINVITFWAGTVLQCLPSVYLMLHDNSLAPRLPHSGVGKCTCGESLVTWSFVTYGTRYRKISLSALNLDVKISSRFKMKMKMVSFLLICCTK